jgi:hypothetical protein
MSCGYGSYAEFARSPLRRAGKLTNASVSTIVSQDRKWSCSTKHFPEEKGSTVIELWHTLEQLVVTLFYLVIDLLRIGLHWWLLLLWVAWWLCGVNWQKAWPVLARGAWVPVVLITLMAGLVFSQVWPSEYRLFGLVRIPNFWWQVGAVSLWVGSALFCGWLQGVFGWAPPEIDLEPPAPTTHGHGHGHGH